MGSRMLFYRRKYKKTAKIVTSPRHVNGWDAPIKGGTGGRKRKKNTTLLVQLLVKTPGRAVIVFFCLVINMKRSGFKHPLSAERRTPDGAFWAKHVTLALITTTEHHVYERKRDPCTSRKREKETAGEKKHTILRPCYAAQAAAQPPFCQTQQKLNKHIYCNFYAQQARFFARKPSVTELLTFTN